MRRPTLDDVFLRLTGHAATDDAGGDGGDGGGDGRRGGGGDGTGAGGPSGAGRASRQELVR